MIGKKNSEKNQGKSTEDTKNEYGWSLGIPHRVKGML